MIKEILLNFVSPVFYQVIYLTIIGSIVGILIYFIRNMFDKKMSGKSKCILWSIAIITLLVPLRFEVKSNYTIIESNFIDRVEDIKYISNFKYRDSEKADENNNFNINHEQLDTSQYIEDKKYEINNKIPLDTKIKNIIIPCIWLIGFISLILTFFITTLNISKKMSSKIYIDKRIESILNQCKEQLNIKGNINIVLQKYKIVPSIFGILNPSILITKELLQEEDKTIKYIFLHELSHYKRKDIVLNYVLLIVLSIHWFNPVIWFLFNKIRQDIEIGADELASKDLTKVEKKEYGMVLITLLKNKTEENYATNLFCMSDTGKNMERRIIMLKGKSKSILLSILVIIIILFIVTSIVFIKTKNIENNMENLDNFLPDNENEISDVIIEEEKTGVEEYINRICNMGQGGLVEFSNINEADKWWIYSQLIPRTASYYNDEPYQYEFGFSTEQEIKEDLINLFGEDLNLNNIASDLKTEDKETQIGATISGIICYVKEKDVYEFLPYGTDCSTWHIIDGIKKEGNQYKVKVIEYMEAGDFEGKYTDDTYILIYNSDDYRKAGKLLGVEEVFKVEHSKIDKDNKISIVINNEVLKRKDKFTSYNITIEKNSNGLFNVKSIKKF